MKKYRTTAKKFAEEIQLPEEAFCDTFLIEMHSNTEIVIDGCKGIIEYDTSLIALNLGSLVVRFHGDNLEIGNFSEQQAIIKGVVMSMEFSS